MELVYYPDPRLRQAARPVGKVDAALRGALPGMFEIMYVARGIGLAGPQVGLDRRIVVANLMGDPRKAGEEQVFINPEILEKSGEVREEEGCLSLPGMVAILLRAERVVVRYSDIDGKTIKRAAEGMEAKLFQHEIDHLDGILIVDKMTPADLKQCAPLLKELEQEHKSRSRKVRSAPSKAAL